MKDNFMSECPRLKEIESMKANTKNCSTNYANGLNSKFDKVGLKKKHKKAYKGTVINLKSPQNGCLFYFLILINLNL